MKTSEFDVRYKKLNAEQREAVNTIEGPVMVIAGPGTGKTTILTLRIANILQKTDTPPSGILAITYTDAGVKAMRNQLLEVIGERAHEVRIHTFHSFAASIIGELGEHFPHLQGATQLSDVEIESFIRDILKDQAFGDLRPIGKPDFYISSVISAISQAKREAWTAEDVRAYAKKEEKKISTEESSISTRGKSKGELKAEAKKDIEKCKRTLLFADVYTRYEAKKKEQQQMDYDDLIIELLVAFKKDELLLRLIQERFLYIHVDEHQDTNDSQNLLISMLADFFETPNVFIVGDEKQAIYRFQGASVQNFLKFEHLWKDMKIVLLQKNYRSHQAILDASFAMIEKNYTDGEHTNLRVKLQSVAPHKKQPLSFVIAPDETSLESHLVEEIKKIAKKEPKAEVAIIVRRNRELNQVLTLLETQDIPVSSERKIDVFSHPAGILFFNLIEYLADPTKREALAKTLVAGLWDLEFSEAISHIQKLRSGNVGEVEKSIPVLREIRKCLLEDAPVQFLIKLAELSGYRTLVSHDPSFVEVWRGIVELAESVQKESNVSSPLELITSLLLYRTSAETRSVKVSVGVSDYPIRAMTAHGSKGLEFDYVFIPYASEESWMGRSRGSYFLLPKTKTEGDDVSDARRLFYVALTRARKHVTILFAEEESGGRALSPLRFISEIDQKSVERMVVEKKKTLESESLFVSKKGSHTKLQEYAKQAILQKGLSVTALNHFINCPSEFLYQSILKLPQAPAPSAEKGTVMHDAFSRVWKMKSRDQKNIEKSILEAVAFFKAHSRLPLFEKEAVEAELEESAEVVAKALAPHFALQGKIFAEEWSESVFEGIFQKESLSVPIHGKLDAIIDTGKEVFVFDYKTRQAMSAAAIKGQTKSSDGSYFRQLVFYELLLSRGHRFKGRPITLSLVFVTPDQKGRCPTVTLSIVNADIQKVRDEIELLIESVWSGKILTETCDDKKCEWCGLKRMSE
ncbi:MAG: hypothetical protein A2836_00280 [Candidatus Taylorbacteria bacterium RIFCSPHIGHO2_01_FULL_45_63]|uniref:DNA 3'-5' helicase n=1 Tax=Candidatus Taylorbacteria bacterium RIFCSPHIGHO2_02_FULL_45_35 TaxID=1802311 RepID=A0A1G2MVL0_9BACT|nr:MAG: hypothetical protein A2836_00280 [Candidatus Taylorbacteria bacterium RIFCSPHIGHO2_01_FULL_45_63]OHA27865.1 MAG: hypothetical protein A3D56_01450 [Candidatus Taylorbacteria bacterium RIFCSPHIGHO2_02_FULL_45_35]OHA32427.1 MAG: hypothetical protein A3A22_01015 [Candidatus Taylorbacteria bacterium RIFCSPLOWO2_01_FULL_45_34b]